MSRPGGNPNLGHSSKDRKFQGQNSQIHNALFNDIEPQTELIRETHRHREIIELAQLGRTNKDIAKITGFSSSHISNVLRQPWARHRLVEKMRKNAQEEVRELLEKELVSSVKTLVEVRDDPMAAHADKIRAANSVLDRFMGRPTQPIQHDLTKLDNLSDEQLAAIATGSGSTPPSTEGS